MTIFLKFIIILLLLLLLLLLFLKSKTQVKEVCLVIMTSLFQGSIALPGFPSEETSQKSRWGLVKKKNMQLFLRQSRSLFVVSPLFHIPPRPRAYKRLKRY